MYPHRLNCSCTLLFVVALGLADSPSTELRADEPAAAKTEAEGDFAPPELLYLTWQEEQPRDPDGTYFPVWKPDGELLSDDDAAELRKQVRGFAVFNPRDEGLHPLVLIFKVDERATYSPTMPALIDELGRKYHGGGSLNEPRSGMILASMSPRRGSLLVWQERGTIEVRYPVENATVVKTLDQAPDGPLEVAQGVTWELNSSYSSARDPATGEYVRTPNKLSGVLYTDQYDADPNVDYDVRLFVNGREKPVEANMHTAKNKPGGQPIRVDITAPIDNPQHIAKIEIIRRRHATKRFENVSFQRELLFREQRKPKTDE